MPKEAEYDIQADIDEGVSDVLSHVSVLGQVTLAGSAGLSAVHSAVDIMGGGDSDAISDVQSTLLPMATDTSELRDWIAATVAGSGALSDVQSFVLPGLTDVSELRDFIVATVAGSAALSTVDSVADKIDTNMIAEQRTVFGEASAAAVNLSAANTWTEVYKTLLTSDVLLKALTMSHATVASTEVGSCALRILYDSTKVFPFGEAIGFTQNTEYVLDELVKLKGGDSLVIEASIAGSEAGASVALVSLKKIDLLA